MDGSKRFERLRFHVKRSFDETVSLSQQGKVVMLVNTAEFCGNTRSMPTWNRCTRLQGQGV